MRAPGQRQRQRQIAAAFSNLPGDRGQGLAGLSAPQRQQLERQLFAEHVEWQLTCAQGNEQIGVPGRRQQSRARPEHVERLGILHAPQVVEDEQAGLPLKQLPQLVTPVVDGRYRSRFARDKPGELALQPQGLRVLPDCQPEDPVGKGAPDLLRVDEIDGKDGLANAAHAVQADARDFCGWYRAGDADGLVRCAQYRLFQWFEFQWFEVVVPAEVVRSLTRNAVQHGQSIRDGNGFEGGRRHLSYRRFRRCSGGGQAS